MEKRKIQRIIGTMVIVALIIIILPLLFGKQDIQTTTAPAIDTSINQAPPIPPNNPQTEETPASTQPVITSDANKNGNDNENENVMPPALKTSDNNIVRVVPETEQPADSTPLVSLDPNIKPKPTEEKSFPPVLAAVKKTPVKKITPPIVTTAHNALESIRAKSPAWVIQMGSFKDPSNARRLADELRTAGYKAFLREVRAPSGLKHVRVYIGPEFKKTEAVQLSENVRHALNVSGIVMSYNPLAL